MGRARDAQPAAGADAVPAARAEFAPPRVQSAQVELAGLTVTAPDLRTPLTRLTELACLTIPGAEAASIVLGPPAEPTLIASSDQIAQFGDGAQLMAMAGPALDAVTVGRSFQTPDLTTDRHWPSLSNHLARGDVVIRSCLATPLLRPRNSARPGVAGVLTLYAVSAGAFDGTTAEQQAEQVASRAVALVETADQLDRLLESRDQLQEALLSRGVIDQVKGMIMKERGCTADEAFQVLRELSNVSNRKLREIAQSVVDEVGHSPA